MENLEDVEIAWLDASIDITTPSCQHIITELRRCINFVKTFTDPDECVDYITSIETDQKIFLIISSFYGNYIVPFIQDLSNIVTIYITCFTPDENLILSDQSQSKVAGSFLGLPFLIQKLFSDSRKYYKQSLSSTLFTHSNLKEKSFRDLNQNNENVRFMWSQLLIEILLRIPKNDRSKEELLKTCKLQYDGNRIEQEKIEDFEEHYQSQNAIFWYTRDSFLYRLLNRAFRTENIDIIFQFRFFFIDLHQQLTELYQKETIIQSPFTAYRGLTMPIDELEKLRENIGGLISMNTFLSTTMEKDVALMYAGEGEQRPENESVLLEIHVDMTISERPFANIKRFSYMEDEEEVLFTIGTVFRIDSIDTFEKITIIKLSLSNEVSEGLKDLMNHFKNEIREEESVLTLTNYFVHMGDFDRAEKYSLALLQEPPPPSELCNTIFIGYENCPYKRKLVETLSSPDFNYTIKIYNNLGYIKYKQGDYKSAMKYYEKVIELNNNFYIPNSKVLAITYNNMSLIDIHTEKIELARQRIEHALDLMKNKETTDDDTYCAILYNNLGSVYERLEDFDTSIKYYTNALDILLKYVPENHTDVTAIYNNLGNVYCSQGNMELSLLMHKKSFELSLKSLPSNHPDIQLSRINLAATYMQMNNESLAKEHLENAIDICSLSISEENNVLACGDMAYVLFQQKDYAKALKYCNLAFEIYERSTTKNRPDIILVYILSSMIYEEQENHQLALKSCKTGLSVALQIVGPNYFPVLCFCKKIIQFSIKIADFSYIMPCLKIIHDIETDDNYIEFTIQQWMEDSFGKDSIVIKEMYHEFLKYAVQFLPINDKMLALIFQSIGYIYFKENNYMFALPYFEKALHHYTNLSDELSKRFTVAMYTRMAVVYGKIDDKLLQLSYYEKALNFQLQITPEDYRMLSIIYESIGLGYERFRNFEKALECYQNQLSMNLLVKPPDDRQLAKSYENLGMMHRNLENYELSLCCFENELEIVLSNSHENRLASLYFDIAEVYSAMNDLDKAREYIMQAEENGLSKTTYKQLEHLPNLLMKLLKWRYKRNYDQFQAEFPIPTRCRRASASSIKTERNRSIRSRSLSSKI